MKLTDRHEDVIAFKGKEFKLGLYYDVVLRSFELLKDDRFNEIQKLNIVLDMFVLNKEELHQLDLHTKAKFVEVIFDRFIHEKEQTQASNQATHAGQNTKKLYDLEKDAEFIYASFFFDYGIDLFEQQGKLHWRKFKALLSSLSDESKFKQVVSIRAAKIPPPNKHNAEQRKTLMQLKRLYQLENTQNVEDIDKRFDQLAASLKPTK